MTPADSGVMLFLSLSQLSLLLLGRAPGGAVRLAVRAVRARASNRRPSRRGALAVPIFLLGPCLALVGALLVVLVLLLVGVAVTVTVRGMAVVVVVRVVRLARLTRGIGARIGLAHLGVGGCQPLDGQKTTASKRFSRTSTEAWPERRAVLRPRAVNSFALPAADLTRMATLAGSQTALLQSWRSVRAFTCCSMSCCSGLFSKACES